MAPNSWILGQIYVVGDTVIGSDGNLYRAVQNSANQNPLANPTYWTQETSSTPGPPNIAEQTSNAFAGVWATANSNRAASNILMSTYDTNPSSTDHTQVFINALNAAAAIIETNGVAQVDILLDSRQKYLIGGAVTAGTQGQWCQIALPWSSTAKGTIRLVGMPQSNADDFYSNTSGTVIESTLTSAPTYSATVGIASTFGCGPASFCTTHTGGTTVQNGLMLATKDIIIRSTNPVICGIDAGFGNGFFFDELLKFDTDAMANDGSLAVCTAPQAIPIIFPFFGDNRGTFGDDLVCSGWLGGPMLGELADIRRVTVFCTAGACLYVDASTQVSQIGMLIDWNNAYGIASTKPTSATPISPGTTGSGSNANPGNLNLATIVQIKSWNVQTTSGGTVPVSTDRVADVLDSGGRIPIDAIWAATTDSEVKIGAPILSNGSATNAYIPYKRIINLQQSQGIAYTANTTTPATPATGVTIRNPYGRDALVTLYNGYSATFTAVDVDGNPQQNLTAGVTTWTPVLVPANSTFSMTYTGATQVPTLSWALM